MFIVWAAFPGGRDSESNVPSAETVETKEIKALHSFTDAVRTTFASEQNRAKGAKIKAACFLVRWGRPTCLPDAT